MLTLQIGRTPGTFWLIANQTPDTFFSTQVQETEQKTRNRQLAGKLLMLWRKYQVCWPWKITQCQVCWPWKITQTFVDVFCQICPLFQKHFSTLRWRSPPHNTRPVKLLFTISDFENISIYFASKEDPFNLSLAGHQDGQNLVRRSHPSHAAKYCKPQWHQMWKRLNFRVISNLLQSNIRFWVSLTHVSNADGEHSFAV